MAKSFGQELDELLRINESCDDLMCECCAMWRAHNDQMRKVIKALRKQRNDLAASVIAEHD